NSNNHIAILKSINITIISGTIRLQIIPPMNPSIVLLGLITGHNLCLPINLPKMYRSEEHTSELQSRFDIVCRLLLEKKKSLDNRNSAKLLPERAAGSYSTSELFASARLCAV